MKILHIHIPKNAGSFVALNLAGSYPEQRRFVVDAASVTLDQLLADADRITATYDYVGGHVPLQTIDRYADRFDLIVSSYRDPWARALSSFRYALTNNPRFAAFVPAGEQDAVEKFCAYLKMYYHGNPATRNIQCGYIGRANLPDQAMEAVARHSIRMLSSASLKTDLHALMKEIGFAYDDDLDANASQAPAYGLRPGQSEIVDGLIGSWFDGDFEFCARLDALRAAG